MAFLIVAGIELDVIGMTEREPEFIGSEQRTRAGKLRTMFIAVKHNYDVQVNEAVQASFEAIRDATEQGQQVTAEGDSLGSYLSMTVRVKIPDSGFVYDREDHLRSYSLTLQEV